MSRPISIRTLLEGWCDFQPGAADAALAVGRLTRDARRARPGDGFVAVAGRTAHGMAEAPEAVARGAAAVLHDGAAPLPELGVPAFGVPGLGDRLGELGARFHRYPAEQLTLAGVAGGSGKTSTAHFIAQSWQRADGAAGTISDLACGPVQDGRKPGPAALDALDLQAALADCVDRGVERMVLELSPRLLESPLHAAFGIEALVFTNSTPVDAAADGAVDGAGLLGLFEAAHPRFAVINHDDPVGKALSRQIGNGTQVLTYGSNGATELRGSVLGMDASGMTIRIASPWGGGELRTGLLGAFNLDNLLGAVGVLALLGMPWNQVMHQAGIMQAARGRLHGLGGDGARPVVVLDEAATPAALERTLDALRSHLHGRLVCVVGCDAAHDRGARAAMAATAESLADRVVLTVGDARDENPWAIFDDMARGLERLQEARVIESRAEAIFSAIEESAAGDIVLVAGRGSDSWADEAARTPAFGAAGLLDVVEDAA